MFVYYQDQVILETQVSRTEAAPDFAEATKSRGEPRLFFEQDFEEAGKSNQFLGASCWRSSAFSCFSCWSSW